MNRISAGVVIAGLVLVLGVVNYDIWQKQRVVESGQRILLELRPVDPRSLIQGDFMLLRYAEAVFPGARARETMPRTGAIVLALDDADIATFVRYDDGSALADNEVRLQYRLMPARGDLKLGAESFFFEEGQAEVYEGARYGVLRVDDNGASVLVGLADAEGRLITPSS